MTAEERLAKAERALEIAEGLTNGYSERATAWAAIATAHATIAQAVKAAAR